MISISSPYFISFFPRPWKDVVGEGRARADMQGHTRGPYKIRSFGCQNGFRSILIAPFGDAYEKIGTIQRRLAWPLHKDDTLFQSGRPTGLNIYFFLSQLSKKTSFGIHSVFSCIFRISLPCSTRAFIGPSVVTLIHPRRRRATSDCSSSL